MLSTTTLAEKMKRHRELSAQLKDLGSERDAITAELMSHMRENGAQITGIEAGGYRASVSFRRYYGYDEGSSADGLPLSHEDAAKRRKAMRAAFIKVDDSLLIPSSEKIKLFVEAWTADPKNANKPLPVWVRESETPTLRVSGSGTAN